MNNSFSYWVGSWLSRRSGFSCEISWSHPSVLESSCLSDIGELVFGHSTRHGTTNVLAELFAINLKIRSSSHWTIFSAIASDLVSDAIYQFWDIWSIISVEGEGPLWLPQMFETWFICQWSFYFRPKPLLSRWFHYFESVLCFKFTSVVLHDRSWTCCH